jgi:hypothetical protein
MKQRITFLHRPEDSIDPDSIHVGQSSFSVPSLQAAREDRITVSFDEVPDSIKPSLRQTSKVYLRYVDHGSILPPPLTSSHSPGLYISYVAREDGQAAYGPLQFSNEHG